jgi:hypothetical protein
VRIPARGHVGGVVAVKTWARAQAIVLVRTILDAPSGVRMQKTQLALTRLCDTGLEVGRVGFGAWAIGGGGWESLSDDGIATVKSGREMATNMATRPRRALFEVLAHVSEDVPEHE